MAEEKLKQIKDDSRKEKEKFQEQWNKLGELIEKEKEDCERINKKQQKALEKETAEDLSEKSPIHENPN